MGTFDSILNVVIPLGVFIFLFVVIFSSVGEPLRKFWEWLKGLMMDKAEVVPLGEEIIYG